MSGDDMDRLADAANDLNSTLNRLNRETGSALQGLSRVARTNRRAIIALAVSLAVDVALTVVLGGMWSRQQHNTERLNALTARLDYSQTVQRQKVLCPLYTLLIASEKTEPPGLTEDQRTQRAASFKVIHDGYDVLDCLSFIKG